LIFGQIPAEKIPPPGFKPLLSVRLSSAQQHGIAEALREQLSAYPGARAWLFGSRADLRARGGDIDLFIELPQAEANPLALTRHLRVALQRKLGDRKIDLVIKAPNLADSALHEIARQEGVMLWTNTNSG
jgi:predicted nucleotidyltransferase